jgi:hypothetical protein
VKVDGEATKLGWDERDALSETMELGGKKDRFTKKKKIPPRKCKQTLKKTVK